jgi:hypothetical protein
MNLSWPAKLLLLLVVLIPVGDALYNNPIHFHQSVKVTDYTMDVPVFWAEMAKPRPEMLAALRREWARSGAIDIVDRAAVNPTRGPWTAEAAQRARGFIVAVEQKDPRFSGQRFFEMSAGRFPALCTESTINGAQAFTCYIIGTRLQFSYLGSSRYGPSALKMLASLH